MKRFILEGDDLFIRVVGTSHYQEALRAIAGDGDVRRNTIATLVAEPDNPHDANAIAVQVDDRLVGYLARDENRRWQEVVQLLGQNGHLAATEARISGGAHSYLGVFLRMPTPTEARAQVGIRFGH